MATLASLKLQEQILLATAMDAGNSYAPTRTKTFRNAEGECVQVTQTKRIKPWWFTSDAGKVCIEIRYGAKVIELAWHFPDSLDTDDMNTEMLGYPMGCFD